MVNTNVGASTFLSGFLRRLLIVLAAVLFVIVVFCLCVVVVIDYTTLLLSLFSFSFSFLSTFVIVTPPLEARVVKHHHSWKFGMMMAISFLFEGLAWPF